MNAGEMAPRPQSNWTLFSQERFVRVFANADGIKADAAQFPRSARTRGVIYGLVRKSSFGRRFVSLAPVGLYAHPCNYGDLAACVGAIVRDVRTFGTLGFEWNVRSDHRELADRLMALDLSLAMSSTHVLQIDGGYDGVFKKFNATMRNHIRRSERGGVLVRSSIERNEIDAYLRIFSETVERGTAPNAKRKRLFEDLLRLDSDVRFLVAEVNGTMVGGGWFFYDGDSMMYWHGASDRRFSRVFPACAVLWQAIRLACDAGMKTFNFGASNGIETLERFKSSWGAEKRLCWKFAWNNQLWATASKLRKSLRLHSTTIQDGL